MSDSVTVIRPELSDEERQQRKQEIEKAAADLIAAIRRKQRD